MSDSQKYWLHPTITAQFILLITMLVSTGMAWADKPIAPDSLSGITTVTTEQAIGLILDNPDLVVIDARLPEEFQKGHIEDAVPLVDSAVNQKSLAQVLPSKTTPVLFYCNGPLCLRSSRAAQKALEYGYTDIYWYRDGWAGWTERELPIAY